MHTYNDVVAIEVELKHNWKKKYERRMEKHEKRKSRTQKFFTIFRSIERHTMLHKAVRIT